MGVEEKNMVEGRMEGEKEGGGGEKEKNTLLEPRVGGKMEGQNG